MSDFPTDAEVEAATHALADSWRGMHTNDALGYQRMLAGRALVALAPLIRAREAAAWDEGLDAGRVDALGMGPEWPDQPTNPYRQEADDARRA